MDNLSNQNEIDLRILWKVLLKRKLVIIAFTIFTTIYAVIYVWIEKPIFSGSVLIEIGDVIINSEPINDKPTIIMTIKNTNNLKEIISQSLLDQDNKINTMIKIPQGTSNLLLLSYEHTNKQHIKNTLKQVINIILERHKEKAVFFAQCNAKIKPTAVISKITILPEPIKPKKQLIISIGFISGLILGIFLAFFLEFIGTRRNR